VTAGQLDGLLVLLVLGLGFLLASFPARSSDLWQHLAAGRLVAEGRNPIGLAQILPGSEVGQAWLYNLVCYALYSALGGAGLVLAKALVVVALAAVLLRLSRVGGGPSSSSGWAVPAVCTALALLAMSTRLLLQPATVSCLFLALTLSALRPRPEGSTQRTFSLLPPWPLLLLFLVWANTDRWFVLGLGVVALVWPGRALDEVPATGGRLASAVRGVLWVALAAAVCLLNPLHAQAFLRALEPGAFGSGSVTSPFREGYFESVGRSPAGLAYFPLLGLGLLSFVLNLRQWSWERFLPWLGLALLGAVQVRTVPFFAVVAGPVLAWNLQEWLARRPAPQRGVVGWRVLALVLVGALVVCAWPGWLQAPPFEPRRWAVEPPPSLEHSARATRRWHQQGQLGSDAKQGHHGGALHLSPETAHAFAWFCPEDRRVQDEQLAAAIRGEAGAPGDWAERMRGAGVNRVVLYDTDRGRLFATLGRLLADPVEWPLLYLEGDVAVFGWRDTTGRGGEAQDPFRGWELPDVNRLAFRPAEGGKAPPNAPDRAAEPRRWWEAFWKPAPPQPIDRDEAILHLFHAESMRRSAALRHLADWEAGQAAALVAAAGGWAGPADILGAHMRVVTFRPQMPEPGREIDTLPIPDRGALRLQELYVQQRDDVPPALLYLAVRAARRAVAVNPHDSRAFLVLGECYLRLLHATRERSWGIKMEELLHLRQAQASEALNRAVALEPDLAQAHLVLGGLYREMGYLDLSLHHLQTYFKLAREAGPPPGVSPEEYREQEARFQQDLGRLAQEVEDRSTSYAVASSGARVAERAALAYEKGLAGKARDLLLESDVAAFGPQGMTLELKLLLRTGRAKDARDWTGPEHKEALGAAVYHWLRAQALAACGDYALAREECAELGRALSFGDKAGEPIRFRDVMALVVGQAALDERVGEGCLPYQLQRAFTRQQANARIADLALSLKRGADVQVLEGLLALEEGEVEEAEVAFRVALAVWHDRAAAASGAGLDFNGRPVAEACLAWLGE
jgi:hypothetical protein